MNTDDLLERAFALLKADAKAPSFDAALESKLLDAWRRRSQPRRLRKLVLICAIVIGVIVMSGGISIAAGWNPLKYFILKDRNGTTWTLQP